MVNYIYKILLIILWDVAFFAGLMGQNVSVNARLDTNRILIGDQVNLILEVFKPKQISVDFPLLTDTIIDKIEIIDLSPVDTTISGQDHILRQYYTITSFDSGEYILPRFRFIFTMDTVSDTLATKPLWFSVNTVEIDTTKNAIADIKLPMNAPLTFKEVLPYILWGALIAVIILAGIYIYIKRKKKEPLIKPVTKPKEPAHIIAYRGLDRIKNEKLWQQNKIKEYHTQVTEVVRIYIEDRFNVIAMEQISDEILQKVVYLVNQGTYETLRQMLVLGDLVKFARLKPLPNENDLILRNAYLFVDNTKITGETQMHKEPIENNEDNGNREIKWLNG